MRTSYEKNIILRRRCEGKLAIRDYVVQTIEEVNKKRKVVHSRILSGEMGGCEVRDIARKRKGIEIR